MSLNKPGIYDFREKNTEHKISVSIFSKKNFSEKFLILKTIQRDIIIVISSSIIIITIPQYVDTSTISSLLLSRKKAVFNNRKVEIV